MSDNRDNPDKHSERKLLLHKQDSVRSSPTCRSASFNGGMCLSHTRDRNELDIISIGEQIASIESDHNQCINVNEKSQNAHQRNLSSDISLLTTSSDKKAPNLTCSCTNPKDSMAHDKHGHPRGKLFTFVDVISRKRSKSSSAMVTVVQNEPNKHPPERETWNKKTEFLLAVIGFAVDLGNVWRFPYVCYRNGGGAFLIPYLVMLIFGGLPLFYLELALGQYYRSGCLTLWRNICPIMKGIGYGICVIDLYLGMYYNTIISWAVYYLMASFTSELPWTSCNNTWNTPKCRHLSERGNYNSNESVSPAQEYYERQVLQVNLSTGIDDLGPIKGSLALCLGLVFILVYFSLWKGVRSTGKAVWITATMPYFVLSILLVRAVTLDGSIDGIKFYLYPQWDKLTELKVWVEAASQVFFSLGPGFGVLLALSSYNEFHNNCFRDAIITSSINCLTSFIAGFATFSVLGYMAKNLRKDIQSVVQEGPGLVFVVYPEAIATMQYSPFWSVMFFIMLITLGIDSTFGGLEAPITGLCDEYPNVLRKHREIFVCILVALIYVCALPTVTYGGNYVVLLLEHYGTTIPLLFIVFVECVAICWLYGANKFALQIQEMLGSLPGLYWRTCWTYISPVFLFFMFTFSLFEYKNLDRGDSYYTDWSISLGWLITSSSMVCIPLYALYHFRFKEHGSIRERLKNSIRPRIETNNKEEIGQKPSNWENFSEV